MEAWTVDYWVMHSARCLEELNQGDKWDRVPLLNTTHSCDLKENHLVRFRGMIQDMYNPVYYLATYEVLNTLSNEKTVRSGKYKDSLQCTDHEKVLFDSEMTKNQERRPVFCIAVPAVNQWAQFQKMESKTKVGTPTEGTLQEASGGVKRSAEDEAEVNASVGGGSNDASKRLCPPAAVDSSESTAQTTNSSLQTQNAYAESCIVNLYDVEDGSLKINDVIEIVGFLSYDATSSAGVEEELPPPSLVPRLHAVAVRPQRFCNPLVTPSVTVDEVMQNASRLREELKLVLTQLLLGDALAADYLICHLISRVYLRQDMLVLGKFCLNLSNLPRSLPDYPAQLYQFLQSLLDKSQYLPMTIETLNSTIMIPKKNYETNRLESGFLQLSDKTHVVLDETQLQPGQLNDKGVKNCQALSNVITSQRLQYDFQFYPIEFNTDIPVLILSEGKSMLPSDCHLALEADPMCLSSVTEAFPAAQHYLKEPLLSQLRVYLSLVSTADYDLSSDVQQMVQEDFVKMRQEQPKTSAQDLHSLLVLAKLLSLSQGFRCLTKECWDMTRHMDHQRKQRLTNLNRH